MVAWWRGDEDGYKRAALDLVSDLENLPRLGRAARGSMLPHHWAVVVERFETVMREAMA